MTKLSLPIEVLTMFQNKCTPELKKTKTKKKNWIQETLLILLYKFWQRKKKKTNWAWPVFNLPFCKIMEISVLTR